MANLPSTVLKRIDKRQRLWSEVGRGWFPLLEEMDRKLAALFPDYTVSQVKEKLGFLRVYVDNVDERAYKILDEYECKSTHICEVCGEIGQTVNVHNWLKTLCRKHEAERREKLKNTGL